MPAYLITHTKGQSGDMLIEDPHLTVEYTSGWVIFRDRTPYDKGSVVLALPTEQVARVERVDDEQSATAETTDD